MYHRHLCLSNHFVGASTFQSHHQRSHPLVLTPGSIDIILLCQNANQRSVCSAKSKENKYVCTWPTLKDASKRKCGTKELENVFLVKMFYFLSSITGCSKNIVKFLWLAQNTASRCLCSRKEQLRLLLLLAFVLGVDGQGRKVRPEILQPLAFLGVLLVVWRTGAARADWGSRSDGVEAAVKNKVGLPVVSRHGEVRHWFVDLGRLDFGERRRLLLVLLDGRRVQIVFGQMREGDWWHFGRHAEAVHIRCGRHVRQSAVLRRVVNGGDVILTRRSFGEVRCIENEVLVDYIHETWSQNDFINLVFFVLLVNGGRLNYSRRGRQNTSPSRWLRSVCGKFERLINSELKWKNVFHNEQQSMTRHRHREVSERLTQTQNQSGRTKWRKIAATIFFRNILRLCTLFPSVCSPGSCSSLTLNPIFDKVTKTRLFQQKLVKFFLPWNVQHQNDLIIGWIDGGKVFLSDFSHLFSNHESNLIFKWVHVLPSRSPPSREMNCLCSIHGIVKGPVFYVSPDLSCGAVQCVVIVSCVCF